MKKISFFLVCFLAGGFLILAMSQARTKSTHPQVEPTPLNAMPKAQGRSPVFANLAVKTFVAGGMPVQLRNAVAHSARADNAPSDDAAQVEFTVVGLGRDDLTSLTILFYDFDEKGLLQRVDGWTLPLDLQNGKGMAVVTVPLERRLKVMHQHVLAVERVNSGRDTWDAAPVEISRAIAIGLGGGQANANAINSTVPLEDDFGAAFCAGGYRRAQQLAQVGDGRNVTSYTCNQSERSFSFSFQGKDVR